MDVICSLQFDTFHSLFLNFKIMSFTFLTLCSKYWLVSIRVTFNMMSVFQYNIHILNAYGLHCMTVVAIGF